MLEGGYLAHWQHAALTHRGDPGFRFEQPIMDIEKVVISKRLAKTSRERTRVLGGPLAGAVGSLKGESGDQIICFGGTSFASALLGADLVDELQLFAGAAVRGWRFDLTGSAPYRCGIVNRYRRPREGARLEAQAAAIRS